jgi:hypothetical protein
MKLPVLLLLLSLSLVGCDTRHSLFFTTVGERSQSVALRQKSDEPGRYLLKEPVVVTRTNRAFYLRYHGGGSGGAVRVLGKDDLEIAAKILPRAEEAAVYLPLKRGQVVQGLRIDTPPTARAELVEAGITDAVSGFENSGRLLTVGTTVQRLHRDGRTIRLAIGTPDGWPLRRPDGSSVQAGPQSAGAQGAPVESESTAPKHAESGTAGWQIALVLETAAPFDYADFRFRESLADPEGGSILTGSSAEAAAEPATRRTSILLRLQSGGSTASFRHSALAGRHTLFLYHGMVPFTPETLSIEPMGGAAVWLESFEIARLFPDGVGDSAAGGTEDTAPVAQAPGGSEGGETHPAAQPSAALYPLPADPGALLLYDPESWRQPEYELFAWSRFPQILIMDTASYAVQSRFFKRLAFFVEKQGYRGRLVSNEEYEGLHGFNAHDYRAEDLARFFQTAREELFPLDPEEELLRQILLANGIILDDGAFSPGRGGILSISRSSYPILRRHLLTHECAHGLFFSLPEFREASFEAWDRLSEQEQEYWKLFFRWVGYDTEDYYLTVNEYQAYLFQQPRSDVPYYFAVLTPSRLISSYPGQASWVQELIRSDSERFTRAFDHLETALVRIAGVEGGRVIELESAE